MEDNKKEEALRARACAHNVKDHQISNVIIRVTCNTIRQFGDDNPRLPRLPRLPRQFGDDIPILLKQFGDVPRLPK